MGPMKHHRIKQRRQHKVALVLEGAITSGVCAFDSYMNFNLGWQLGGSALVHC